jgi:clan AA aspartic protease (TIGR02281 family)
MRNLIQPIRQLIKLCGLLLAFLFTNNVEAQVDLPNKEIVKAYFDRNYSFIKKTVEADQFNFQYLQTNYNGKETQQDLIEVSRIQNYTSFVAGFYLEGERFYIQTKYRVLTPFRDDEVRWVSEMMNGSVSNSFNPSFRDVKYIGKPRPVITRLLELKQALNLTLGGFSQKELEQMAVTPVKGTENSMVMTKLSDEKGFELIVSMQLFAQADDQSMRSTPPGTLFMEQNISISGNEYSILKFFGIDVNQNWGSISCKSDGLHTYIPVTFVGSKYDYLLDTGASFLTVSKQQARELILTNEAEYLGSSVQMETASGALVEGKKIVIHNMQMGGVELTNVLAVEVESDTQLLGMSVLKKFSSWSLSSDGKWFRYKK